MGKKIFRKKKTIRRKKFTYQIQIYIISKKKLREKINLPTKYKFTIFRKKTQLREKINLPTKYKFTLFRKKQLREKINLPTKYKFTIFREKNN
jgi:hypothetical protein